MARPDRTTRRHGPGGNRVQAARQALRSGRCADWIKVRTPPRRPDPRPGNGAMSGDGPRAATVRAIQRTADDVLLDRRGLRRCCIDVRPVVRPEQCGHFRRRALQAGSVICHSGLAGFAVDTGFLHLKLGRRYVRLQTNHRSGARSMLKTTQPVRQRPHEVSRCHLPFGHARRPSRCKPWPPRTVSETCPTPYGASNCGPCSTGWLGSQWRSAAE